MSSMSHYQSTLCYCPSRFPSANVDTRFESTRKSNTAGCNRFTSSGNNNISMPTALMPNLFHTQWRNLPSHPMIMVPPRPVHDHSHVPTHHCAKGHCYSIEVANKAMCFSLPMCCSHNLPLHTAHNCVHPAAACDSMFLGSNNCNGTPIRSSMLPPDSGTLRSDSADKTSGSNTNASCLNSRRGPGRPRGYGIETRKHECEGNSEVSCMSGLICRSLVDMSRQPSSLEEAVCMYIDYLTRDNQHVTQIDSNSTSVPFPNFDFIHENYYHEVMCRPIKVPTPRFHDWLQLYGSDLEITDTDGKTVSQKTFPPAVPFCSLTPNVLPCPSTCFLPRGNERPSGVKAQHDLGVRYQGQQKLLNRVPVITTKSRPLRPAPVPTSVRKRIPISVSQYSTLRDFRMPSIPTALQSNGMTSPNTTSSSVPLDAQCTKEYHPDDKASTPDAPFPNSCNQLDHHCQRCREPTVDYGVLLSAAEYVNNGVKTAHRSSNACKKTGQRGRRSQVRSSFSIEDLIEANQGPESSIIEELVQDDSHLYQNGIPNEESTISLSGANETSAAVQSNIHQALSSHSSPLSITKIVFSEHSISSARQSVLSNTASTVSSGLIGELETGPACSGDESKHLVGSDGSNGCANVDDADTCSIVPSFCSITPSGDCSMNFDWIDHVLALHRGGGEMSDADSGPALKSGHSSVCDPQSQGCPGSDSPRPSPDNVPEHLLCEMEPGVKQSAITNETKSLISMFSSASASSYLKRSDLMEFISNPVSDSTITICSEPLPKRMKAN